MDESGERELNTLSDKKARTMTGSVVASLAHLKDIDGNDGAFFVFPDLSVRCEGVYRLKFSLFEIVGNQIFFCKSVTSSSFTVYSAKKFPGMEESTHLTRLFAEQGLKIRVRKEQKSTRPKGGRSRPITTALQPDNSLSAHRVHMPAWGSPVHRLPTSAGMAYANPPPPHHFERQAYSSSNMPNNSTSVGSVAQSGGTGGGGASSLQRATSPHGSWSGVPMRLTHNSGSALSQSPPLQPSVPQYAPMSDMQRNSDFENAGHQHYGQHHPQQQQQQQQQHKSRRGVSPNPHNPLYQGRQQAAGYTHTIANTLSSPNMDVAHSAFATLPPGSQHLPAPHSHEPRYSPYTRQVDAPPRDSRQHLSPGPGARIAGSFVPPSVGEIAPIYSDQPLLRHQQHPLPQRATQVDNLQYYHLAPTQRSAQHVTGPPLTPEVASPAHGLPPPPPPAPLYAKHDELSPRTAPDSSVASASAPSQQHRIAVRSLLISDSSSSPEKTNGSPQ
ncbi:hypothetical protein IW152_004653 [Coemansia sp. BCRC 34962]|nr:hypothetical protein IW152_004653 [Coemansia sp. BCRC 34962]